MNEFIYSIFNPRFFQIHILLLDLHNQMQGFFWFYFLVLVYTAVGFDFEEEGFISTVVIMGKRSGERAKAHHLKSAVAKTACTGLPLKVCYWNCNGIASQCKKQEL